MTEQVPQSPESGTPPDTQMSQGTAATMAGPDSTRQFPNPVQGQGQQPGGRDWEASYRGLSRKYEEDRQKWEADNKQMATTVDQLGAKFSELEQKLMQAPQQTQEQPRPGPKPAEQQTPAQQTDSGTQDYLEAMAERDAVLHRDKLLFEYMGKHPDLGLAQFRENIPVVAPDLNDDGTVNDKGQREAIEGFISKIGGTTQRAQQATQQAMTEGWTPGVSPGAPQQPGWNDLVDRYYKVKEQYSDPSLDSMAPDEQARVQQEYYDLHEKVGKHLPHQTSPWMGAGELAETIRQIQGKVGHLEGFMMKQPSPGS